MKNETTAARAARKGPGREAVTLLALDDLVAEGCTVKIARDDARTFVTVVTTDGTRIDGWGLTLAEAVEQAQTHLIDARTLRLAK